MDELTQKMQKAIANIGTYYGSEDKKAEKCAEVARAYAITILDTLSNYKTSDGNQMYTNILKKRMSIQCKDI